MKKKSVLALLFAIGMTAGVATTSVTAEAAEFTQAESADQVVYGTLSAEDIELLRGMFDYEYYKAQNPDLVQVIGDYEPGLFAHFYLCGIFEGRTCNANFDPAAYASAYSDVKDACGSDIMAYYKHYLTVGAAEGRNLTTIELCANEGITVTSLVNEDVKVSPKAFYLGQVLGTHDYKAVEAAINSVSYSAPGGSAVVTTSTGTYVITNGNVGDPAVFGEAKAITDASPIATLTVGDQPGGTRDCMFTLFVYKCDGEYAAYATEPTNCGSNNYGFDTGISEKTPVFTTKDFVGSANDADYERVGEYQVWSNYLELYYTGFNGDYTEFIGQPALVGTGEDVDESCAQFRIQESVTSEVEAVTDSGYRYTYTSQTLEDADSIVSTDKYEYGYDIEGVYADAQGNIRPFESDEERAELLEEYHYTGEYPVSDTRYADEGVENGTEYAVGGQFVENEDGTVDLQIAISNDESEFGMVATFEDIDNVAADEDAE